MRTCFRKTLQRLAIGLATTCLIILPTHVHALGFGSIRVKSALNEPLNAEIDLLSATEADLKGLKVSLASREAFARAGIDRPAHLENIGFSVQRRASGQAYLKLTSKQSVREPFLDFLLEMNWKSGRMLREYTVLLDPPGRTPAQPGVLASPKTVKPEAEPLASESIAAIPEELLEPSKTETEQQAAVAAPAEEPAAEEAVAPEDVFTDEKFPLIPLTEYQGDERMDYPLDEEEAPPEASHAETKIPAEQQDDKSLDYGMVKKNDKLWLIAKQLKPEDGSVSLFQVMMALLRSNPDAFVKNNVHRLKAGYVLRLEDRALLTAMTRQEALAEYTVQTRAWEAYRQERAAKIAARRAQVKKASDAGVAGEAPAEAVNPATKGAELVLAAPEGETQSSGSGTKAPEVNNEVVILREEIKQALAEAEGKKDSAFNAKLRDLEGELKDLQRSLTVKDDELAVLQKQLSDINKQAEETELQRQEAEAEKQEAAIPVEEVQPQVEEEAKVVAETPDKAEEAEQAPQEASFFKDNLALIILAIGGVLAAVLAAVFFMRRRQERSALEQSLLSDIPPEEAVASDELSLETNLSGESSFLSDFVVSGGASDTDVDPLTEADVFMAYGRYEAAEERIRDAIKKDPERLELHTKLLEIHNTTKNTEAFEAEAEKFFDKIEKDPTHSLWQKVAIMGSMLVPGNPLFASAAGETAEQADVAQDEMPETSEPAAEAELESVAEAEEEQPVPEAVEEEVAVTEEEVEPGYFNSEAEQATTEETSEETSEAAEDVAAAEMSVDEELDSIMSNLNLDEKEFAEEEEEMLDLDPDFLSNLKEDIPLDVSDLALDSDLSAADLDVGDTEAELDATDVAGLETPPVVDEVGTKLDLAKAYIDMGDPDGARSILDEVLEEGTPPQQQEAQQLMQQI